MLERDSYDEGYFTTLYGAVPRQTWADRSRDDRVADLVRKHAPPRRGDALLDVGCGYGYLLRRFRGGFKLHGIDLSEHAVRQARARLDGAAVVAQANVEDGIPFRGPFRVVLAVNVVEHLNDPRRGVANLRGALAPEGLCVVHLPTVNNALNRLVYRVSYAKDPTHVFRPSGGEVVRLFRSEGFRLLEESYAPHAPSWLWNALKAHPAYLAAFGAED